MGFFVPRRRPSPELLDDPQLPWEEMQRSLADLDLVSRKWGGARALERHLAPRIRANGSRPATILDVGAGSGAVSRRLQRALSRAGCASKVLAIDLQWRHLAAGRRMSAGALPPAAVADAFRLPFGRGAVDFVVSTLFFHHFSPAENESILREFTRVARRGFAIQDLRRHLFPEIFVSLAGRLLFRTRVSVEDGVASVRQAYTPAEALEIARRVSPGSRARRVFPFRLLISGEA